MSLSNDLVFLILQFLNEEKHTEAARMLEKESGLYFNLDYLQELLLTGKFDEAERYLLGFIKVEDNKHSTKIFFEIRKQKYLEALDRKDRFTAMNILNNDLKVFRNISKEVYREITELITLEDFRENEQLKQYRDTQSQRIAMFREISSIVQSNPLICNKLAFPSIKACRLRALINQSLNLQHKLCKDPQPIPDVRTLFTDHTCAPSNGALTPSPVNNNLTLCKNPQPTPDVRTLFADHTCATSNGALTPSQVNNHLMGSIKKMPARFQPQVGPVARSPAGWLANPSTPVQHAPVAFGAASPFPPLNAGASLQRPRTPPACNGGFLFQLTNSKHVIERPGSGQVDETWNLGPTHPKEKPSENDLPKIVLRNLNQGSNVVSMDFHPRQQTVLLVGTDVGDIAVWEVGSSEKLTQKSFKDWDNSSRILSVQATISNESVVPVKRCIWSPDGALIGVALSQHLVHMYCYNETCELRQHLEINAHIGSVNDIAFVHLQGKLCLISCGDDKTIKVWDAETGCKQYTFEGHEAPVYSVCPQYKVNVQFILSIDVNGKIKAWLYDHPTCKIDYDAPGHGCTAMAYSADGSRFFTCGTNKEGESYLVEWQESDGVIKRRYFGFEKQSSEVVKFATTKNRFLAAGDECQIKFWDMDNINILLTTDAEGGLQDRPCLCFNKDGSLLAVTTRDSGIKILANADGVKLVKMLEGGRVTQESKPSFSKIIGAANTTGPILGAAENLEKTPSAILLNGVSSTSMVDDKQRLQDEGTGENESTNWKFTEVMEPVHCKSIRLTDPLPTAKIVKLLYTYSGSCLLALDSNAAHKLWMWQRNALNPSGKVKANAQPQIWQPPNNTLMKNDTSDRSLEEVVPCLALSRNDWYIISASGGSVSLFNIATFKVLESFMPPPPAATCLAFNPFDNNIIAIGMEDSTILVFNIRLAEVIMKLKGHQKRITGLAFSKDLNVLASSGADGQLCVWNINGWEQCKSKGINSQAGRFPSPIAVTTVQFNNINQAQLLVVQESQIAIYDASELECLCHWTPQEPMPAHISCATFSCDGLLVYASFFDGSIGVFDSEVLRPRCRIAPSAFIPDMGSGDIYPLVIAANPHVPNQIAVGLTDGGVHVIELDT